MIIFTKLVGIINITPDSFSDNVDTNEIVSILGLAQRLVREGADMLDIGAESSNPTSQEITVDEELGRLWETVKLIKGQFPKIPLSLDTRNPEVAKWFLSQGGSMINDYKGLVNDDMISVVRETGCLYVVNHFPGRTIQEVHNLRPKITSVRKVVEDLLARKRYLLTCGISEQQIILDPGIGFGKSLELNWRLMGVKTLLTEESVMIGFSKKKFLGNKRLLPKVNQRAGNIAIRHGCEYLRVHNPSWFKEIKNQQV